jgi:hypothetical protein
MAYFPSRTATFRAPFWPMVYIAAGLVIAATHHYFANVNTLKEVASAILAVVLWPLLLLGINLHVH